MSGSEGEARTEAKGIVETAEASGNPYALSYAIHAYGYAYLDTEPLRALDMLRRGVEIAQSTGNRWAESALLHNLFRAEARCGDPAAALDSATASIRLFYDAGAVTTMRNPLASLATFLDGLGHHGPAATIAGFAADALTMNATPEIVPTVAHLRETLGDSGYESLAGVGESMAAADMVRFAYDQIDRARAELASRG